jgi:hypothetical protein
MKHYDKLAEAIKKVPGKCIRIEWSNGPLHWVIVTNLTTLRGS